MSSEQRAASSEQEAASSEQEAASSEQRTASSGMEPRWIEASESPFGVRVFDCRAIATAMAASSPSQDVAELFMQTRTSDGSHLFGRHPSNPVKFDVDMTYPKEARELPDRGVIFRAGSLEEKWDIVIDDRVITFARSWTGEPVYLCDISEEGDNYVVRTVVVSDDIIDPADEGYHVHVVNYLLWSHVFDVVYPHPLPLTMPQDEDEILMHSFSAYGRRGWFATMERFG